jgi:hypothetical protein
MELEGMLEKGAGGGRWRRALEEGAGGGRWKRGGGRRRRSWRRALQRALEERVGGGCSKRELEELERARIREMQQERTVYLHCMYIHAVVAAKIIL